MGIITENMEITKRGTIHMVCCFRSDNCKQMDLLRKYIITSVPVPVGYHNKYHKDEYAKNHKFYDSHHDDGHHGNV